MLKFPYREAVGVLMWTATMTWPDIACTVRAVVRFWKPWTGALLKDGDVGHTSSGGSRSVNRAVDSAWRRPRLEFFGAWIIDA